MADGEAIEAAIGAAIEHVLREHGGEFTLKWLALVETSDSNGERGMWAMTSDDLKAWDTLGLLEYGKQRQVTQLLNDSSSDD